MTRKTSLSRQGSLSNPTFTILTQLSRQSSLTPRSRQGSESTDHPPAPPPSSYYVAVQKSALPKQKSTEKEQAVAEAGKKATGPAALKKSWFGGNFAKIIKSDHVQIRLLCMMRLMDTGSTLMVMRMTLPLLPHLLWSPGGNTKPTLPCLATPSYWWILSIHLVWTSTDLSR